METPYLEEHYNPRCSCHTDLVYHSPESRSLSDQEASFHNVFRRYVFPRRDGLVSFEYRLRSFRVWSHASDGNIRSEIEFVKGRAVIAALRRLNAFRRDSGRQASRV
jgi:hypothetical protein